MNLISVCQCSSNTLTSLSTFSYKLVPAIILLFCWWFWFRVTFVNFVLYTFTCGLFWSDNEPSSSIKRRGVSWLSDIIFSRRTLIHRFSMYLLLGKFRCWLERWFLPCSIWDLYSSPANQPQYKQYLISTVRRVRTEFGEEAMSSVSRITLQCLDSHNMVRHVLGLRMEETASRCRWKLRMYWVSSRGQSASGSPPAWGWGRDLQLTVRKSVCYEMLHSASDFAGSLWTR